MADSGGVVLKTYESETGSLTSYNTQRKGPRPPETKLFLVSTKIPFYDLPGDEGIVENFARSFDLQPQSTDPI